MNPPRRRRRGRGRGRGRKPSGRPPARRQSAPEQPAPELLSLDDIGDRLETVLEGSTADETEIVWLEVARGRAVRNGSKIEVGMAPERTVLVRVLDLGRVGSYRTGSSDPGDLASAVRMATAQSRVREPLTGLPHLPADNEPLANGSALYDEEVGALTPGRARQILKELPGQRATLTLDWASANVVVYNSRKVRRRVSTTSVALEALCGLRAGAGRAADATRRLSELNRATIVERARERQATGEPGEPPGDGVPVVLAPEAANSLIEMLNQESFSAKAYYDGTSFLREHLGVQVFDRALNLIDDGTDASGLPFPFDLEGTAKREVSLIVGGAPKTPALDQRQAAVLGLPPTAHAIGGNDARAQNVFLRSGELDNAEVLEAGDGGIWIGWLDHLECREPNRVHFGARARGVRRIEDGRLGAALPDLYWEDSLLRAFSAIRGLGKETARQPTRDGYLGGFSAPAVAVAGVEGLRVL